MQKRRIRRLCPSVQKDRYAANISATSSFPPAVLQKPPAGVNECARATRGKQGTIATIHLPACYRKRRDVISGFRLYRGGVKKRKWMTTRHDPYHPLEAPFNEVPVHVELIFSSAHCGGGASVVTHSFPRIPLT